MTTGPDPQPTPGTRAAPGRRSSRPAGRRLDLTLVVAVLLPLLVAGLAVLGTTDDPVDRTGGGSTAYPPTETALSRSSVVCPSGDESAFVASESGAEGQVGVRQDGRRSEVDVTPDRVSEVRGGRAPAVVTGVDELAPGLVAGRFASPLAAADCRAPVSDQWFTGAGAGATHDSVLELVNPDAGRALVDVVVLGPAGEIDAPRLRGLAVPGDSTVSIDLGETVPQRGELALHVSTIRGRVSAHVLDTVDELGAGTRAADWLGSQPEPSRSNRLLGVPSGPGQRTLVIANPGMDEGRATLGLVTSDAVFTPEGVEDVVLPPQSVVRVPLAPLLDGAGDAAEDRPLGIQVDSTVATTASARFVVGGDLALTVPSPPLEEAATVILPPGERQLVLAGDPDGAGASVTVTSRAADGSELDEQTVEVPAGRGVRVDLPEDVVLLTVVPDGSPVAGAVQVSGDGITVVRLRSAQTSSLVPDVRPAPAS